MLPSISPFSPLLPSIFAFRPTWPGVSTLQSRVADCVTACTFSGVRSFLLPLSSSHAPLFSSSFLRRIPPGLRFLILQINYPRVRYLYQSNHLYIFHTAALPRVGPPSRKPRYLLLPTRFTLLPGRTMSARSQGCPGTRRPVKGRDTLASSAVANDRYI